MKFSPVSQSLNWTTAFTSNAWAADNKFFPLDFSSSYPAIVLTVCVITLDEGSASVPPEEHSDALATSWLPFVHLSRSPHLQQAARKTPPLPSGSPGGPSKLFPT